MTLIIDTTTLSEREYDQRRKAEKRAAERDIVVPDVVNPARRAEALADPYVFLETYFADVFYQQWTEDRREMIDAILHATKYVSDQAIAGPRGDGKTGSALYIALYLALAGSLSFTLIVSKSQKIAERELKNKVKNALAFNDLLAEDFPEVCTPIRELDDSAARARLQTVEGVKTRIEWAADHIIFPTIDGYEAASGQVIASLGVEGALRGLNYRDKRPQLAIIDDIDDRESARSETQTETRCRVIDEDIAGLAGPDRRVSRVFLGTLLNDQCAAAIFTDPKRRPGWGGKRFKMLRSDPERIDLWQQYMDLRQQGKSDGSDPDGREAHRFYLENREVMDAGGEVSNPERFTKALLSDGEPAEVSALQHCFNLIADVGRDAFDSEYQNDPPKDDIGEVTEITAQIVRSRVHGLPRRLVPADAQVITGGMDIGKRMLHYTLIAWVPNARGYVIDHDIIPVFKPDELGITRAIVLALKDWHDRQQDNPLVDENGEIRDVSAFCIDDQYQKDAVEQFIRERGQPFRACHGYGTGHPGMRAFSKPKPARGVVVGERWYARADGSMVAYHVDSDYWKRRVHQSFMVERDEQKGLRDGSLTLYQADDTSQRRVYSDQVVAEIEKEEFVKGKGMRRKWVVQRKDFSHWLDATMLACVAASMAKVRLMPSTKSRPKRRVTGGWQ